MEQTLSLEMKVEFFQNSGRVNSVDLHPTKPWILVGFDSGNVAIWNYQTKTEEKSFEVSQLPVRSAKFIARKHWIVVAAEDKFIYVYDYNNQNKIERFEAHKDKIRSVAVHLKLPYVISAADDKVVNARNWEGGWHPTGTFQGHTNSVMQVAFDPIHNDPVDPDDPIEFASVSLDNTLKIWNLNSPPDPLTTLNVHSKAVNCVDYFMNKHDNKLYLLSGSDDFTAKVWDWDTKSCVQKLEGHVNNVTAVGHLPKLIITASEDKTVKIWDAVTYELKISRDFGLGKVWSIGYKEASDELAFGCDKGFNVVKMTDQSDL